MHECHNCGQQCDCDGEDHGQPTPIDCECPCEDEVDEVTLWIIKGSA